MFFFFSKILSFILAPLTWVIILLAFAAFLKNSRISRNLVYIALIALYLFSNPFLADEMIRLWQIPVEKSAKFSKAYDVGIVLGGGMITIDKKNNRLIFKDNVDRIMQAVSMYKKGMIRKILISGGSGNLLFRDMIESELLKEYFVDIGIVSSDIIVETKSDNTYENSKYSKEILLREFNDGSFLLITSAIHMKRAKACFNKQNIEVDIFPADQLVGGRRYQFSHMFIPETDSLAKWNIFLHEVLGYYIYKIMGYA